MKATIEDLNSVQKRVKIALPAETVNREFDSQYRQVQKKASLKGFRPGKAPINIIKKIYGGMVSGDVAEALVNRHLPSAISENNLRPVATPVVENLNLPSVDKEFEFSAVVDIMPEFQVQGYRDLAFECENYEVKPETVEREINFLRRRQARTKAIEEGASAAKGHLVNIGHQVFRDDGTEVKHMAVPDFAIALGQDEIFGDLEKEILGMKKGETKEAKIKLPKEYNDPDLSGKDVLFKITLNDLQELLMPEFNDDLAKDLDFENAAQLKTDIEKSISARADQMRRQKLETIIMEKLSEKNAFDVPPSMVDHVIDSMIDELGIPNKAEVEKIRADKEIRKNFLAQAKKKAQNTLLLWRIAQQEKLEVSDDEVKDHLRKMLGNNQKVDDAGLDRIAKSSGARFKDELIFSKALDVVINSAKIKDIPASL